MAILREIIEELLPDPDGRPGGGITLGAGRHSPKQEGRRAIEISR